MPRLFGFEHSVLIWEQLFGLSVWCQEQCVPVCFLRLVCCEVGDVTKDW